MNENILKHYRSMWLQLGNIYDKDPSDDPIEHGVEGRLMMIVARHLDACGISCPVQIDPAAKKAVEDGIPIGCIKVLEPRARMAPKKKVKS